MSKKKQVDERIIKPVDIAPEKVDVEKELKRTIAGLKGAITERNKRIEKLESRLKDCEATIVYLEQSLSRSLESNEEKDKTIQRLSKPCWKRLLGL